MAIFASTPYTWGEKTFRKSWAWTQGTLPATTLTIWQCLLWLEGPQGNSFFKSFSKCTSTERIIGRQVLQKNWLGILTVIRFEPRTAGYLCAVSLPSEGSYFSYWSNVNWGGLLQRTEVEYLLLTQHPLVRFSAVQEFFSWCCWDLPIVLLRTVDRGLIM